MSLTLVDSPPFRFPVNSVKLFCGQEYCISLSIKFFWYPKNCEVIAEHDLGDFFMQFKKSTIESPPHACKLLPCENYSSCHRHKLIP